VIDVAPLSDFDGKTLRLLRYADTLKENGYRIEFLTTKCESLEIRKRFRVFEVPIALGSFFRNNYRPILSEIQNTSKMAYGLSNKILKLIPNYSIVLSSYNSSGLLTIAGATIASYLNEVPHIFDYDDLGPDMSCAIKGWSMAHPFFKAHLFLEKLICQRSDAIIAMSEMMRKILVRTRSSGKISVIHNVPPSKEFDVIEPIKQSREMMGLQKDVFVFAYLGNVQQRIRGLEMIVEAVNVLKDTADDFLVLIIGTGTGENHLKNKIHQKRLSKYFLFTGRISKEQAISYLNAANVSFIILPPIEADYMAPTKLFISMALGKHIVVTDSEQVRLILGSRTPIFVKKNSTAKEIAVAMLEAQTTLQREDINEDYRNLFFEKYCWEKEKEEFTRIVRDLA